MSIGAALSVVSLCSVSSGQQSCATFSCCYAPEANSVLTLGTQACTLARPAAESLLAGLAPCLPAFTHTLPVPPVPWPSCVK